MRGAACADVAVGPTRVSATSVMSSSCSPPGGVNAPSSVSTRSITSPRPERLPTTSIRRGKPNISPSPLCASATPSEWSSIVCPGSSIASVSSYETPGSRPSGMPVARSSIVPDAVRTYGRLWPALAKRNRPVAGSTTP